jgi:hypothetical protein
MKELLEKQGMVDTKNSSNPNAMTDKGSEAIAFSNLHRKNVHPLPFRDFRTSCTKRLLPAPACPEIKIAAVGESTSSTLQHAFITTSISSFRPNM